MLAEDLEKIDGAQHKSVDLTLVVPPWNFPTAIPAGGVLAGLAAGSAVIFKPATITARTGALIAEIMWNAGVPKEVLKLVKVVDREAGKVLISHPEVDRLILTGGYETAELFRSWRDDLPLFGETSARSAPLVPPLSWWGPWHTPSASAVSCLTRSTPCMWHTRRTLSPRWAPSFRSPKRSCCAV